MIDRIYKELCSKVSKEVCDLVAKVCDDCEGCGGSIDIAVDNIMKAIEDTFKTRKVKYIDIADIDLGDNDDR